MDMWLSGIACFVLLERPRAVVLGRHRRRTAFGDSFHGQFRCLPWLPGTNVSRLTALLSQAVLLSSCARIGTTLDVVLNAVSFIFS
ncbi:hypothetical protein F4778DRAFT_266137 [Xylariomycetidae sp. FL2044]|nr:hypothetical protein F4778DRAFT_266137 [Xylariomycetidae sp. FL2044]